MPDSPFITLGGDAKGAVASINEVARSFRRLRREGETAGQKIAHAFGFGVGRSIRNFAQSLTLSMRVMKSAARLAGGAFSFAYRKARLGVLGLTGAIVASTIAWNKEIIAQTKINAILKKNTRDFARSRKELDKIISTAQRTTSFGDRDIEGIFSSIILGTGKKGFGIARRFTPTLLDFATQFGLDPASIALNIGRAIGTGEFSLLKRQGILIDEAKFKTNREGAIFEAISKITNPRAAEDVSSRSPFKRFLNNFGDVMENIGRPFAERINPILDKIANRLEELSRTFKPETIRDVWDTFIKLASKAWEIITRVAVASFAGIKAGAAKLIEGPIAGFKAGLAGRSLPQYFGSILRRGVKPTLELTKDIAAGLAGAGGAGPAAQPTIDKTGRHTIMHPGTRVKGAGAGKVLAKKALKHLLPYVAALSPAAAILMSGVLGRGLGFGMQAAFGFGMAGELQDPKSPFRRAASAFDLTGAGGAAKAAFEESLGMKISDIPGEFDRIIKSKGMGAGGAGGGAAGIGGGYAHLPRRSSRDITAAAHRASIENAQRLRMEQINAYDFARSIYRDVNYQYYGEDTEGGSMERYGFGSRGMEALRGRFPNAMDSQSFRSMIARNFGIVDSLAINRQRGAAMAVN